MDNDTNLAYMSRHLHSKTVPAGLGILTHIAANIIELDHYGYIILPGGCALLGAMVTIEYITDRSDGSLFQAAEVVGKAAIVFFVTLLTSMTVYRVLFHRLRKVRLELSCRLR